MRQKMPFIVIGLLVGIVVMQLAMPAAQSQTGINLRVNSLTLVDENDQTTALLFNGDLGPILALGADGTGYVLMGAGGGGTVQIYSPSMGAGPRILMNAKQTHASNYTMTSGMMGGVGAIDNGDNSNRADMTVGENGGHISTIKGGDFTAVMPGEATVAKPVTWGQIKRDPTPDITAAGKPIIQGLQRSFVAESGQMLDEYLRNRHSLR